jgi:hypothetical protein
VRRKEIPLISDEAVKLLLVFSITYLCECGLSSVIYIKNKYRNRLNTEPDLRLKLKKLNQTYGSCVWLKKQILHNEDSSSS